jgi:hypothetical protein
MSGGKVELIHHDLDHGAQPLARAAGRHLTRYGRRLTPLHQVPEGQGLSFVHSGSCGEHFF